MAELIFYAAAKAVVDLVSSLSPNPGSLSAEDVPELKPVATSEGAGVVFHMGRRNRIVGVVRYVSEIDVQKGSQSTGDGKGSISVETQQLSVNMVVTFGQSVQGTNGRGKADDIRKVWVNSTVLYDTDHPGANDYLYDDLQIKLAGGGSTAPDIVTDVKSNVPAWRGHNYVAIDALNLTELGVSSPPTKMEALVQSDSSPYAVQDALTDIFAYAQLPTAKVDVSRVTGQNTVVADDTGATGRFDGYQWTGITTTQAVVDDISTAFDLLARVNGDTIEFLDRGYEDIVVVDWDDLGQYSGSGSDDQRPIRWQDAKRDDLPSSVTLLFQDPKTQWQRASMTRRRENAPALNPAKLSLPMTLETKHAKRIVRRLLWIPYIERRKAFFRLPPKYINLQETDVLAIVDPDIDQRYYIRIDRITVGNDFSMQIEGVLVFTQSSSDALLDNLSEIYKDENDEDDPEDPDSGDEEDGYTPPTIVTAMLDLPPLTDEAASKPGFYFAHTTLSAAVKFLGGTLYKSNDGGTSYKNTKLDLPDVTMPLGFVVTGPTTTEAAYGGYPEPDRSLVVQFYRDDVVPQSFTLADNLQGLGFILAGQEILAYQTAELVSTRRYRLTGLMRGMLDTADHAGLQIAGDRVLLLDVGFVEFYKMNSGFIGKPLRYKEAPLGFGSAETSNFFDYTNVSEQLRCFRPAHLHYLRTFSEGDGDPEDVIIRWVHQTREPGVGPQNPDGHKLYENEKDERYRVEIYSDVLLATLVNSYKVFFDHHGEDLVCQWTYTATKQSNDGLSPGQELYVRIQQLADVVKDGNWSETLHIYDATVRAPFTGNIAAAEARIGTL